MLVEGFLLALALIIVGATLIVKTLQLSALSSELKEVKKQRDDWQKNVEQELALFAQDVALLVSEDPEEAIFDVRDRLGSVLGFPIPKPKPGWSKDIPAWDMPAASCSGPRLKDAFASSSYLSEGSSLQLSEKQGTYHGGEDKDEGEDKNAEMKTGFVAP